MRRKIQIRTTVAGLNPHDQKARDAGLFIADSLPAILGNDITGISQLSGYRSTARQQYAVVDAPFSSKIPEGFTDDDATTLPTNAIAALIALFDPSRLDIPAPWSRQTQPFDYAGTTLLILGGGSNCGRFGVQFAKMAEIGKIVVVGGSESEMKGWGATHVLDRHGGDEAVIARVRDAVGDELVYVFDAVNPPEGQHVGISSLSSWRKGRVARLRASVGKVDEGKIVGEKREGYDLRNVLGTLGLKADTTGPFWDRSDLLKTGLLVPLRYEVVDGLDVYKVNEVLERYKDGEKVTQTHFKVSA
ncbi:hypothetical protein B9Z65_7367 [Elsinoe australis]|uniref:Uncharacterized protein n=1 Tax=Elsinoe australis TaxID=40998 RepID=A0A2P7YBZ9_9PEZI|nr:hypothetical protein B9Z65_7367 [Elsinoe australis]